MVPVGGCHEHRILHVRRVGSRPLLQDRNSVQRACHRSLAIPHHHHPRRAITTRQPHHLPTGAMQRRRPTPLPRASCPPDAGRLPPPPPSPPPPLPPTSSSTRTSADTRTKGRMRGREGPLPPNATRKSRETEDAPPPHAPHPQRRGPEGDAEIF